MHPANDHCAVPNREGAGEPVGRVAAEHGRACRGGFAFEERKQRGGDDDGLKPQ